MKKHRSNQIITFIWSLFFLLSVLCTNDCKANDKPHNIILLLAEDICPDLSCYGTPEVQTPNLDALAGQGIRFTKAYATSPVCSPSRSAMMTGMMQTSIGAHQHRTLHPVLLPGDVKPITYWLKKAGYFTALGCGYNEKLDLNFKHENLFDGNDWSEREKDQPFFAQITFGVTHRDFRRDTLKPVDPEKVFIPPYYPDNCLVRRDWADYLESIQLMDRQIGEVLQRLKNENLEDNTIVIFCGDNGRCHVRGKEFLYEGGIHIPLIVALPNNENEYPSVSHDLVSTIDISAEILNIAGIKIPEYMEGKPFLDSNSKKHDYIIAARDRCGSSYDRMRCVITPRFKYIRNFLPQIPYHVMSNNYKRQQYPIQTLMQVMYAKGALNADQARFMSPIKPQEELYDLENDPFELNNLANDPSFKTVLELQRERLTNWIEKSGDNGRITEDADIAAKYHEIYYFRDYVPAMRKRGLDPECSPIEYLEWWKKYLGCSDEN